MSLKNCKIPTKGYKHSLGDSDLAQPMTEEEKLKTKDWRALIESHMRLACSIAGRYISKGADPDEMVSAAMLGICVAVDKIKKGKLEHDNITGYIVHYIHQHCSEVRRKDTNIPQPRGNKIKGTIELPEIAVEDFVEVDFDDLLDNLIETDEESLFIELRRKGFTDQAIADKLNVSRSHVTKTRIALLERYNNTKG